jgi:hypothetical protein
MNDSERIIKAVRRGNRMLGPAERERCAKHPRRWVIFRWEWDVPGPDETHEDCISGSEPEVIRGCAMCDAESEDEP